LAVLLVLAAACLSETDLAGPPAAQDPATGPYVVTAIDYHFHDAHPSMPINRKRALQFSNQGSNLHNVTIPGTDFLRNIRPGRRITIPVVGSVLGKPGRYQFFCALHVDRGMKGVLVVT
jgi:hypothetical protein